MPDKSNKKTKRLSPLAYALLKEGERRGWWIQIRRLSVACSGGADSVALLLLLAEIQPELDFALQVLHFNHRLRPSAEKEADFVRDLAAKLDLPFKEGNWVREEKENVSENAARIARYRFLEPWIRPEEGLFVALGHHRDDQAETMLLHLFRGSGLRGLGGMHTLEKGLFRPLLSYSSNTLKAYLRERGVAWCEDESNLSPEYRRNSLRLELLPLVEARFGSGVSARLSETAEQLRELQAWIDGRIAQYLPDTCEAGLPLSLLQGLPSVLRLELIHAYYRRFHPLGKEESARLLRSIERLCLETADRSRSVSLPGGWLWRCQGDRAYMVAPDSEDAVSFWPTWELLLSGNSQMPENLTEIPFSAFLSGGYCLPGLELSFVEKEVRFVYNKVSWKLPLVRLQSAVFRRRQTGDWVRLPGGHTRSLKRHLIDLHVPAHCRNHLLFLAEGQEILWPVGETRRRALPSAHSEEN